MQINVCVTLCTDCKCVVLSEADGFRKCNLSVSCTSVQTNTAKKTWVPDRAWTCSQLSVDSGLIYLAERRTVTPLLLRWFVKEKNGFCIFCLILHNCFPPKGKNARKKVPLSCVSCPPLLWIHSSGGSLSFLTHGEIWIYDTSTVAFLKTTLGCIG